VQDERRIQDYLSGRLPSTEAEAFEAQMFADDELAAEVERALEIRAAMQDQPAAPRVTARRATAGLPPAWAMAAGIATLGIGLVWFRYQSPTPVFRGVEQTLNLEVEVAGGKLNARWAPAAGAHGYELQTFAADGQLMDSVSAKDTTVAIELRAAAVPAYVEVVALDDFGQAMLRSQRVRIDAPDVPDR
jgi:anti-sigma factor RsiW